MEASARPFRVLFVGKAEEESHVKGRTVPLGPHMLQKSCMWQAVVRATDLEKKSMQSQKRARQQLGGEVGNLLGEWKERLFHHLRMC